MKSSRSPRSKNYYLPYQQLEDLLKSVGVTVAGSTGSDLIAYCPFHNNRDTPAFNISLSAPHLWRCHNGKCAKQGNIVSLLTGKGYSRSEAEQMLLHGSVEIDDLLAVVEELFAEESNGPNEWGDVDPQRFRDSDEANGWPARDYMLNRGISQEAIDFFGIGYSKKKNMAVVPVYNEYSELVGIIGREIESKRYQYSTGLSRGQLVWNINNAREYDSIILCEGSLDAVYVWQAGWKNVGAVLGSAISPNQWALLRKYFSEIICFFDNDDAGNALRDTVIDSVSDLSVSFVQYPDNVVTYTDRDGNEQGRPVKDPGELTVEEISSMLENRKSSLELLLEGNF
jgi:5S rRNA maturation endonuclease (ribonuclease M5)